MSQETACDTVFNK